MHVVSHLWKSLTWNLLGFLWKESLSKRAAQGGAHELRWLQPRGRRQTSGLAIMRCFVSSRRARNCDCLCCCCCCGEGGRFHPVLVLSVAWEGREGEGRPGARSRVENSWMLPLRPQRMFRAHIRCDQWCHLFCLGKNGIPLITQWALSVVWGSQYFRSDKQINTFNALFCFVHTWEFFCTDMCEHWDGKHNVSSWAHKVAFKKERINKRGVCCNFEVFFSWQHPHLVDTMGYCIVNLKSILATQRHSFSCSCCFSFEEHDKQINSTSWPLFSSLSDERYHAVHLPSAGWKIQAEEHTFSVWDEGKETLSFSDKILSYSQLEYFLTELWCVFVLLPLSLSLTHTHTHTHTHRWANLSWTMCWTVLGSRCLTSLLRSQPGELLMAKILKWSAWIWWWLAQDSPPLIWSNAFRSKALESAVIVCLSLSSVQSERGRTGSTRWVEP